MILYFVLRLFNTNNLQNFFFDKNVVRETKLTFVSYRYYNVDNARQLTAKKENLNQSSEKKKQLLQKI